MSSKLSDIALPVREVTLSKLKTRDGAPVVVRCEAVAEDRLERAVSTLQLAQAAQSLPGAHPPAPRKGKAAAPREDAVFKALEYAEPVIEIGCSLAGDDGADVFPAFCFCGKHPDAIPGRLLGAADKMALFVAVMEVGGYSGGAVEQARFPDEPGGGAAGARAVGAGEGNGDAPGGPASGSEPTGD